MVQAAGSDMLTVQEVAQQLKISAASVYDLIKRKRLAAYSIGARKEGHWRIRRRDFERFLAERYSAGQA